MTLALPPAGPRHAVATATGPVLRVYPAPGFEPHRHRRRRTELMQLSVYDLTGAHSPCRPPLLARAARYAFELFVSVFGSGEARRAR